MNSPQRSGASAPQFHATSGRKWAFSLVIVLLAVTLYSSATRFAFLNYDDDKYVTANPHVQAGLTADSLRWSLTAHVVGHWQPVTLISHMLDCQFYGVSPAGHHLTSVLLHALNAVLLFLVLLSLTRSMGLSCLVAALFAVHPMNIENVAWIAERKTLVSALFSLLAIAAYQWYATRPVLRRYLLVILCFVLALASKATAITLPVIFLGLDYWPLNRVAEMKIAEGESRYPSVSLRRVAMEKIPLFLLCAFSAWVTFAGQEESHAIATVPLAQRIGHAAWSYIVYVGKLIWPSHVSILYPYVADPWWKAAAGFVLLIAVSMMVYKFRRERYLVAGWGFYLVSMLPVIGLIQVGHQSFADHFLYVPEIGVFMMAVWGGKAILDRVQISAVIRATLAAALVLTFAAMTTAELPYWKNSYTVFAHAEKIAGTPDFVIENNLAQGLVELGRPSDAIPHYEKATALAPENPLPHFNLASQLAQTGEIDAAINQYKIALSSSPDQVLRQHILHNLGAAYAALGKLGQADEEYTAAIELAPNSPISFFGRGQVRFREGRFHDAGEDFARAADLQPLPAAYYWIGRSAMEQGRKEEAVHAYSQALRIDPKYAPAQQELAKLNGQ